MKHVPHASSSEKILVTGGAGFIGQHLLRALVAAGHHPTALTRDAGKVEKLSPDLRAQVRWVALDLSDGAAVRDLINAERPATLFHLAGTRGVGHEAGAAALCEEINVRATLDLLRSTKGAGVERVVMTGSADEYGRRAGQLRESQPLQPVSAYGISKAKATRLARALYETENCPVVILRPFTVYGQQQPRGMFVAEAIECAVGGQPFRMSEGLQRRDLVYVSDVVRALMLAASAPEIEGEVINIGSGHALRLLDVARLIWKLSESSAPLLVGERPATPFETHDTWADITLAGQLLDWKPRTSLEDGLRATIEWAREVKKSEEQKSFAAEGTGERRGNLRK
jgi:nucleoside-diphosphate-sugar epimerase